MNDVRTDIVSLPIGTLFKKMAIPGIIGTLILGLYNLVDGIFVGQIIGPEALGGVTLVYSVVLINQAFLVLLGSGSMAVLSIAVGKKESATIKAIFGNMVILLGAVSLLFSVVVFIGTDVIIGFLGGKGAVFEAGKSYLKIISAGFVFAALGPAINMLIRGEGHIKNAMKILCSGVILNIALDFLLISVFKMGVSGAALATVISQSTVLILNITYLRRGKSVISLTESEFRVSKELLKRIVPIGSSSMILLLMASLQQILLFKVLARYDTGSSIPLMGVAYRILIFAVLPFAGIGQGLQSVIGINFGAGNFDRVKKAFTQFTIYSTILAALLWVSFMLFPAGYLKLMLSDPILIQAAVPNFRIFFAGFLFIGIANCSTILFQAMGNGRSASLVNLVRQVLLFIPALLLLPAFWGIQGVWLAMPVSEILSVMIILVLVKEEYKKLQPVFALA